MSALEATAALAGIAAVAGASSKQFIGGAVPKRMTRVADRSYYGPWSAKGLNLPATWSVTPGGAARNRGREVRANAAAAAAHPPNVNVSLNEVLAQLAAGVSFRNPQESSAGHRAGLISDAAAAADDENEDALPPFQSVVESAFIARAAEDATAEGGITLNTLNHKPGPPPLPKPPSRPSSVAYVASSPAYQSPPPPPPALIRSPGSMGYDASAAPAAAMAMASGIGAAVLPPSMSVAGGVVACVVGSAVAAFLLALIPVLQAVKGAADEIAGLAAAIREEVPDTLAAVRLSGLELTDCLEEVGELTHEVGSGVKSTGRAVTYTVDTAGALGKAAADGVKRAIPVVKEKASPVVQRVLERAPVAVEGVEARLEENASTEEYSGPVVVAAARATKSGVQYARGALRAAGVAKKVGQAYKAVRDMNKAGADEVGRDERLPRDEDA
mmetsp:Transcript_13186/g.51581  ORF Transcript_13186/g.51581 Transcript_13186/m.51581 type:complete len:443 (-) Transcript_13186:63-1391(-)